MDMFRNYIDALAEAMHQKLPDAQIVEMVENAIRDNPKDFPLKYYLNAV